MYASRTAGSVAAGVMKSSPAAAAVVAARGGGPWMVSGACGVGNVKCPNKMSAEIAAASRCAASCAVIDPNDQPNSAGGPLNPELLDTQRHTVMTSETAR